MSESVGSDYDQQITDESQLPASKSVPDKSKAKYEGVYEKFVKWQTEHGTTSFDEVVLMTYFHEVAEKCKPSTLWSIYSMLKATMNYKQNINIDSYKELRAFLMKINVGYKSKKSNVLSSDQVEEFLTEAPDEQYLDMKVALIIGIHGACKGIELCHLTINDIRDFGTALQVKIPNSKTHRPRSFLVDDEYYLIVKKYMMLRPENAPTSRFFLNYKDGKCTQQVIGRNKIGHMPQRIAQYLKLEEPESYTGHSFRRTSATLLAESGTDMTSSNHHSEWNSSQIAGNYMDDSIVKKKSKMKLSKDKEVKLLEHLVGYSAIFHANQRLTPSNIRAITRHIYMSSGPLLKQYNVVRSYIDRYFQKIKIKLLIGDFSPISLDRRTKSVAVRQNTTTDEEKERESDGLADEEEIETEAESQTNGGIDKTEEHDEESEGYEVNSCQIRCKSMQDMSDLQKENLETSRDCDPLHISENSKEHTDGVNSSHKISHLIKSKPNHKSHFDNETATRESDDAELCSQSSASDTQNPSPFYAVTIPQINLRKLQNYSPTENCAPLISLEPTNCFMPIISSVSSPSGHTSPTPNKLCDETWSPRNNRIISTNDREDSSSRNGYFNSTADEESYLGGGDNNTCTNNPATGGRDIESRNQRQKRTRDGNVDTLMDALSTFNSIREMRKSEAPQADQLFAQTLVAELQRFPMRKRTLIKGEIMQLIAQHDESEL